MVTLDHAMKLSTLFVLLASAMLGLLAMRFATPELLEWLEADRRTPSRLDGLIEGLIDEEGDDVAETATLLRLASLNEFFRDAQVSREMMQIGRGLDDEALVAAYAPVDQLASIVRPFTTPNMSAAEVAKDRSERALLAASRRMCLAGFVRSIGKGQYISPDASAISGSVLRDTPMQGFSVPKRLRVFVEVVVAAGVFIFTSAVFFSVMSAWELLTRRLIPAPELVK